MVDNVFAIIIFILMLAHFIATIVALLKEPDLLFGEGVRTDEK